MNKALHKAKLQEKEKCLHVLTQSHTRFSCLNEVSICETFHLGQEHALLDPLAHDFFGPEAFDAANRVDINNYDLDYCIAKKHLEVDFVKELDGEETKCETSNKYPF